MFEKKTFSKAKLIKANLTGLFIWVSGTIWSVTIMGGDSLS